MSANMAVRNNNYLIAILFPAGQDVTEAFYSLHRHEILQKSQFARLQVGTIKGEQSTINSQPHGSLSLVPYAEPTWLTQGYHSPYYKEVGICSTVVKEVD